MPKLYEYLGIIIFFYANEHRPVHVHAKKGELENKVEFLISEGEIVEIKITKIKGVKSLSNKDLKNLKTFLAVYADEIVKKWVDYFVYQKRIEFKKITKRLK